MTPEQAAAVERVRKALAKDTDGAFYSACDPETIRAILAALDAAQAPREVPSQEVDEAALARLRERGAVAWADVPDAAAWVDEQRGSPREVPRLTGAQMNELATAAHIDYCLGKKSSYDLALIHGVESRVRELCGVKP